MTRHVAIVGSGPAGCYAAERLAREADVRVDVFERLPTPFGLARAGVAPDHQSTKSVTRVFDRALSRPNVALFGNVAVGRDLSLSELRQHYDAVVLATGAPRDRRLGVPGEELAGIVPSGCFVGWYNGHPDQCAAPPALHHVRTVVVIGNGNVALDVARMLAKRAHEFAGSDLDPEVAAALAAAPLEAVHIVGRRGPEDAHFAVQELSELGELAEAQPIVHPHDVEGAPETPILAILRAFALRPPSARRIAIDFHFRARPVGFAGSGRVERARFERMRREGERWQGTGELYTLPADLVVTCIGYESVACGELAPADGRFANDNGRIADGLYAVGWAKRGPSGTIATNRAESHAVAERLLGEVKDAGKSGSEAVRRLLGERGARVIDHAAWQRLDAAERARAELGRVRRKFRAVAEMLEM